MTSDKPALPLHKDYVTKSKHEEEMDKVYEERNLLALLLATGVSFHPLNCGWYYDTENNYEGFERVISISEGKICFHIPDSFDTGSLQQIKPNWDGHSTEDKYNIIKSLCGVKSSAEKAEEEIREVLKKHKVSLISGDNTKEIRIINEVTAQMINVDLSEGGIV